MRHMRLFEAIAIAVTVKHIERELAGDDLTSAYRSKARMFS